MWGEQGRDVVLALKLFTGSCTPLGPPEMSFVQAPGHAFVVPQAWEMNPFTKVQLVNKLNEWDADGARIAKASWHSQYKDSTWIFPGGLPHDLTERDIFCVFSQYSETININLVWDRKTAKSKGFCFICYEDQRSMILAIDNLNGKIYLSGPLLGLGSREELSE